MLFIVALIIIIIIIIANVEILTYNFITYVAFIFFFTKILHISLMISIISSYYYYLSLKTDTFCS